ncbi:MAG: helix-turn-helix transcriptional regulator [Candidatus Auribacterota bacterium]
MKDMNVFSSNIVFLRNYCGLNQSSLAKLVREKDCRVSIHPSTISAWERGLTRKPSCRTIAALARAFNDFFPFPINTQTLTNENIELKLQETAKNNISGEERLKRLESRIDDLEAYFKYCLCRLEIAEKKAADKNGSMGHNTLSYQDFTEILKQFGVTCRRGVFKSFDGTDVSEAVGQLMPPHLKEYAPSGPLNREYKGLSLSG